MKQEEKEGYVPRDQYEKLESEVAYLKDQLAQLQRLIFGKKNERFIPTDTNQTALFDQETVQEPELETQEVTYERSKPKKEKETPVRALLPAHLPREEEVIEPDGLPEDAGKRKESEVQKQVDGHTSKADQMVSAKEQDIMTV